ncbi:helix-turn-helix domain-containing protein, partial [Aerococcus urinaeequi]
MYQGIECKIYPNEKQRQLIHMTFGHTRFIWNEMLAMLNARYENNPDLQML